MARQSLFNHFLAFIVQEKKWWLIPLGLVLLIMAGLALVGSSPVAPFIYPLF
jgi:hypothetical protein